MHKWYPEEWHFRIEVLAVGKDGKPAQCRIGLEPGDEFECDFATPADFCPTSFIKIFPIMEALRNGSDEARQTVCVCPDGVVRFRVTGTRKPA